MTTVGRPFVARWAADCIAHMGTLEPRLFSLVGPAATSRGFYEPDELAEVAGWKTPRTKPLIADNAAADVRELTALAFVASEHLQHRLLTMLSGVQVKTATALLAVAFPDRHTVYDRRSAEALDRLGAWDGTGGYLSYLAACRRLATRLSVDLRTLDRALWRWSKVGCPAQLPS